MPGYIDVDAAIKASQTLQDRKRDVMSQIDIVRTELRNAFKMGGATPEQVKYVEGTYPIVRRKRSNKK